MPRRTSARFFGNDQGKAIGFFRHTDGRAMSGAEAAGEPGRTVNGRKQAAAAMRWPLDNYGAIVQRASIAEDSQQQVAGEEGFEQHAAFNKGA